MDSKNIQSILRTALESVLPSSQIQLWPAVKASLVEGKHSSFRQGEKMNTIKSRRITHIAFAALVIVTLLAVAFATPQGRAFISRNNSASFQPLQVNQQAVNLLLRAVCQAEFQATQTPHINALSPEAAPPG